MEHLKAHGLSECLRIKDTSLKEDKDYVEELLCLSQQVIRYAAQLPLDVEYHICENIPSFQQKLKECQLEITNALQACAYFYLLDEGCFTAHGQTCNPSTLSCHDFSDVLELQLCKVGRALRGCENKGYDIPLVQRKSCYSKETALLKEETQENSTLFNSTKGIEKETLEINVEKLGNLLKVDMVDKESWQKAFGCPLNKIEYCECLIQKKYHKQTCLPEVFKNTTNRVDLYTLPHLYEEEIHSLDWECETRPEGQLNFFVKRLPKDPLSFSTLNYIYVDKKKSLKEMIEHLKCQKVLSIDTEHHDRHSYCGITCLLQISTEFHDFIIDPLPLRKHLWLLNKVTTDPAILKILHGADSDVIWLQEDFSIYIVNLFDTCIASQMLSIQGGNSLENLLYHFCRVRTDKKYQLKDWRKRPLTKEMIEYARKDTHYLIYIADCLINTLVEQTEKEKTNKVLQVLQKSRLLTLKKVTQSCKKSRCLETLRKDMFYDPLSDLLLTHLVDWRDAVARSLDESTFTILSNVLIKLLAINKPLSWKMFQKCVYPIKPILMHFSKNIIALIQKTVSAYEACQPSPLVMNEKLKEEQLSTVSAESPNQTHSTCHTLAPENVAPNGVISLEKLEESMKSTFETMDLNNFIFYEIPKFRVMASIQYKKDILEDDKKPLATIEELYNLKQWNCGDHKNSLFAKALGQRVVLNCLKSTTHQSHALTKETSFASEKVKNQTPIKEISSRTIGLKELGPDVSILDCVSLKSNHGKNQSFQNIISSASDMIKNVAPVTSLPLNECRKSTLHALNTKQAKIGKKDSCNPTTEQMKTNVIQLVSISSHKRKRQPKFSSLVNTVLPTCAIEPSQLKIPSLPRTHRFYESSAAKSEKHKGPNSSKKRRKFGFK